MATFYLKLLIFKLLCNIKKHFVWIHYQSTIIGFTIGEGEVQDCRNKTNFF